MISEIDISKQLTCGNGVTRGTVGLYIGTVDLQTMLLLLIALYEILISFIDDWSTLITSFSLQCRENDNEYTCSFFINSMHLTIIIIGLLSLAKRRSYSRCIVSSQRHGLSWYLHSYKHPCVFVGTGRINSRPGQNQIFTPLPYQ